MLVASAFGLKNDSVPRLAAKGPPDSLDSALLEALNGDPQAISVYGDGPIVRNRLFIEDRCSAIELVIAKGTSGEIYCVCDGNERKNLDLVHLSCDTVGRHLRRAEGMRHKLHTFMKDHTGHDHR